jgi:hypothetical protein
MSVIVILLEVGMLIIAQIARVSNSNKTIELIFIQNSETAIGVTVLFDERFSGKRRCR